MPLSAIEPQHYDALLDAKAKAVSTLLAPFEPPKAEIVPSTPEAYRMRAEFRVWHEGSALDYVMFRRGEPKTPIPITVFPIACLAIQQLMPLLLAQLQSNERLRSRLFQVEFLTTLSGEMLVTLIYHRRLDEDWEREATLLGSQLEIFIVGRSRKQKIIVGQDYVTEKLTIQGRDYTYQQFEQAFTQPNAEVNVRMIEWACQQLETLRGDLLELYCGNGNFTLPMARHFPTIIATELSKSSIRAAQHNLQANQVSNIHMIRLSAQEVTQAMRGEREFRRLAALPQPLSEYALETVFVDPPRAGLDPETLAMVAKFDNILYISCNPESLAENLQSLYKTHQITALALFDQFPYTPHMESGVLLQQRIP